MMSLRPCAKVEVWQKQYKVAVDAEEGRRWGEDKMVEIRKSKREESLRKSAQNLFNNNRNYRCLFKPPSGEKGKTSASSTPAPCLSK